MLGCHSFMGCGSWLSKPLSQINIADVNLAAVCSLRKYCEECGEPAGPCWEKLEMLRNET